MPAHVRHLCRDPNPTDYVIAFINLGINTMFLIGSFWFLPADAWIVPSYESMPWRIPPIWWACWLFIVGSLLTCVIAARNIYLAVADPVETLHLFQGGEHAREERNEFFEACLFFVSGIIFFVGSVLFMPGPTKADQWMTLKYEDHEQKEYGEQWGAYLFIIGSYGFVISGFFNGYGKSHADWGMQESKKKQMMVHLLKKYGLLFVVLGSAFFVVGSFMYRPGLQNSCPNQAELRTESAAAEETEKKMCLETGVYGTLLYIWGSALFVMESVFAIIVLIIKHMAYNEEIAAGMKEGEEIQSGETLGSDTDGEN